MNIKDLNTNGYNLGEVTHFDFKMNGPVTRDYGYRVLVTISEDCFFVIKYAKDKKDYFVVPKSIKYFVNMPFDRWQYNNNNIRQYDARPDKPKKLPEFLLNKEDVDRNKTNKTELSLSGIAAATKKFFQDFEQTREEGGFVYHSYYGEETQSSEGVHVSRIACTTNGGYNVVLKIWLEEGKDTIYSVKFDKTPIEVMSKEWNMVETELDQTGRDFLDQLAIKGKPIEKDEDEDKDKDKIELPTEVASTPRSYFESKIFAYSNIIPLYFIIGDKARIVLTIKNIDKEIYAIWDFKGGEEHRITLSAKAFDTAQTVSDDGTTWDHFNVTEDDFIDTISEDVKQLRLDFSKHCFTWSRTMNAVSMVRV